MKKAAIFCLSLLCALLLSSCIVPIEDLQPSTFQAETVPSTLPSEADPGTLPQQTSQPAHSPLYIPEVSVEDVILYFNEVCLNAEFINGGDPTVLQKWNAPIVYMVHGTPTQEDLETLDRFVNQLNLIEGFPGIRESKDPAQVNLNIYFCSERELVDRMGSQFYGMDGAVTFWYDNDEIYSAIICCRTEIDQYLRNSVIQEELYNGLGPIQDTSLRPDSLIYSEFSQPQEPTEIDELLLCLLYHPKMQCGMDRQECEAVIRELYY